MKILEFPRQNPVFPGFEVLRLWEICDIIV